MDNVKIGVVGSAGRMGRMLVRCIQETQGAALIGGTEPPGSPAVGADLGELAGLGALGIAVTEDPVELFAGADAVIDFTAPAATTDHAGLAAQAHAAHVIGTTGLDSAQHEAIARAARHTAVVLAPNMSLGVTLLTALVEQVAAALDADYDIEVVEMHHRRKVDAPSGTALALGRAAAAGRGVDLEAVARRVRDGQTGARPRGEIGFATLRGGDVVGDHTVVFAADGERIELSHKASTREIYARGAIKAALWAFGKPSGLYSMKDVLGLG
jgi:4-hydroxy-tetrahydrodipicolinate reductase